MKFRSLLF